MRLWKFIKEEMMKNPSQAVCEGNAKMSYEELVIFSETFAEKLKGEKSCAVLCNSEMATAMGLLACFAAGITAVPISMRYGEQHCKKIFDTICPTAMITDAYGDLAVVKFDGSEYKEPDIHPALIMCTSGTTGAPKGAMLSEDNIITNVKDICAYFNLKTDDSILISRPLYHCAVLTGEFLTSLVKGVKIRFYSEAFNPHKLLNLIEEHKISTFGGTPTLISMLAKFRRKSQPSTLKNICISGECMSAETGRSIAAAFPSADIYHVYGLTEACPRVSYLPPNEFSDRPDSVGIPLRSVSLKIMTDSGNEAKANEVGILYVKGQNVMIGYYNAPEQSSRVLCDGWLCTGDMATMDKDGFLKIKGRSDNLIIRAGMNIYPQEIEQSLKADPRVREVLAYGYSDDKLGVQIGLKIVGSFDSIDEVKQMCSKILPSYQIPTLIEILDELPKNGSGKIIRPKTKKGDSEND